MGAETKIQWTDFTFNPWIGCTKVSAGCAQVRVMRSQGIEVWGKGAPRKRNADAYWQQPLRWNNTVISAQGHSHHIEMSCPGDRRPRVFCASLADWLDDEVPDEWLADLLKLIHDTPNLDWQLLTKRPENFERRLNDALQCVLEICDGVPCNFADFIDGWVNKRDMIPSNVWIGATAENQVMFEQRYGPLSEIPARVRFWSMEPLLEGIDFTAVQYVSAFKQYFHWVIVGGESGPGARVCHTDDVYDIVSQCENAGVACFVKQLGSNAKAAGRHQPYLIAMEDKKGGNLDEWHPELRVRQFPEVRS